MVLNCFCPRLGQSPWPIQKMICTKNDMYPVVLPLRKHQLSDTYMHRDDDWDDSTITTFRYSTSKPRNVSTFLRMIWWGRSPRNYLVRSRLSRTRLDKPHSRPRSMPRWWIRASIHRWTVTTTTTTATTTTTTATRGGGTGGGGRRGGSLNIAMLPSSTLGPTVWCWCRRLWKY